MQLLLQIKMEDAEEIEHFYEKETENLDREFLKNIKDSKDKKRLKEEYEERLSALRLEYEKRYGEYLRYYKKGPSKKVNKKGEKEKSKQFKVTPLKLKQTKKERASLKYDLFKFRLKIKVKNIFRAITPRFLRILFIKTRMIMKRDFLTAKNFFKKEILRIKEKIVSKAKSAGSSAKKICISIIKKGSLIIKKIIKKINPEKKGGEEKKTEDQKLAEKILAKK